MLQCLETSLPYGGEVATTKRGSSWIMRARAERVRADKALWEIARNAVAGKEFSAAHVHFPLAAAQLRAQGRTLVVEFTKTEITLTF